jgi:hypothetical protein
MLYAALLLDEMHAKTTRWHKVSYIDTCTLVIDLDH